MVVKLYGHTQLKIITTYQNENFTCKKKITNSLDPPYHG